MIGRQCRSGESTERFKQLVLCFVELRNDIDVVGARACQVLLGQDVFQDIRDIELPTFATQIERLLAALEASASRTSPAPLARADDPTLNRMYRRWHGLTTLSPR